MYTSEEQIKTTAFSSFQIESAIAMWAKCIPNVYLQGIDFTPPQPQNRIPIDQTLEITSAQLQNFVKALFVEIKKMSCIVKHGLTYIEITERDRRNPTPALMNALKKANIDTKFYSCFGYNLMRIYSNGNIQFNDEVYCTNDETSHYDTKVDFSNAPYMRVNLGKYKLFAIPYTEGDALYSGWVDKKAIVQLGLTPYTPDEVTGTLYMSIKLDDFLGSEEELLRMTAEDLKDILMYGQYEELERNWTITSSSYRVKSQSINSRKHSLFSNIKYHFNNNDNQREFNKSMLIAPGIFLDSSLIILGCIVLIPTINTFLLPMPIATICIGVTLIT